jgi:hypothetical protein
VSTIVELKPAKASISEQSSLAREVMDLFVSKVDSLPVLDTNLIVLAALETAAWIAAEESAAHCKIGLKNEVEATTRLRDYARVFHDRAQRDLAENYDRW